MRVGTVTALPLSRVPIGIDCLYDGFCRGICVYFSFPHSYHAVAQEADSLLDAVYAKVHERKQRYHCPRRCLWSPLMFADVVV